MRSSPLLPSIAIASILFSATILPFGLTIIQNAEAQESSTLDLGNPILTINDKITYQKDISPKRFVFAFEGTGSLTLSNGTMVETKDKGAGFGVIRDDGTVITYGRVIMTSANGGWSAIIFRDKTLPNSDRSVGIAFGGDRASGDLESLGNVMMVYRAQIDMDASSGSATFWKLG